MARHRSDVLLITSTIAPAADVFLLSVKDPASRLDEYCAALEVYLGLLDRGLVERIVYADNSGRPLDRLAAIAARRGHADQVEFVSFTAEPGAAHSRYYLEMRLIETAFRLSTVLRTAGDRRIWKVTGRYIVGNIAEIITTAPEAFDLYVNCRNHPERLLDFFVVAFRSRSFHDLLGRDLEDFSARNPPGERVLRDKIDAGVFAGMTIVPRLVVTPNLTGGRRGWDGAAYGARRGRLRYLARVLANRIVPGLWV